MLSNQDVYWAITFGPYKYAFLKFSIWPSSIWNVLYAMLCKKWLFYALLWVNLTCPYSCQFDRQTHVFRTCLLRITMFRTSYSFDHRTFLAPQTHLLFLAHDQLESTPTSATCYESFHLKLVNTPLYKNLRCCSPITLYKRSILFWLQ